MKASRYGSVLIRVVMGVCFPIVQIASIVGLVTTLCNGEPLVSIFLIVLQILWLVLTVAILQEVPWVTLAEDGVWVRTVLRKRFYPWNQICQAGILYRMGRGMWYNDFILLKPNGSPRRYKDKMFPLRNIGKLIHIADKEQVRQYVIKHYGPLDFNLSNGQVEQSVVVE